MSYWKQKAAPWVSFAVLAGGMASALILFFLVRVESNIQGLNSYSYEEAWEQY